MDTATVESNLGQKETEEEARQQALAEKYVKYVHSAEKCVRFAIAKEFLTDYALYDWFPPSYTHQIFQGETVFGYERLQISFLLTPCKLSALLTLETSGDVPEDMAKPDDIEAMVNAVLRHPLIGSDVEFRKALKAEQQFVPFGEKIRAYTMEIDSVVHHFEVYRTVHMTKDFMEFVENIQSFMMWFIDAASYSDYEDPCWIYYALHEKINEDGRAFYPLVGFCTCYAYYMYPDLKKPRIAQFLILPTYQRAGHGSEFLRSILANLSVDASVAYVTVEDPSDEFTKLMDFVDALSCCRLQSFKAGLLKKGFSKEMEEEALRVLKMNKDRAWRAYGILRLAHTNPNNAEEYKRMRLDFKAALYQQLRMHTPEKMEKLTAGRKQSNEQQGSSTSNQESMVNIQLNKQDRYQTLQVLFDDLVEEYEAVIVRLRNSHEFPVIALGENSS